MTEKFKVFMLEYPLAEIKQNPFRLAEAYGYLKAMYNTAEDKREKILCDKLECIVLTEIAKIIRKEEN